MRNKIIIPIFCFLFFLACNPARATQESSCVTCHTSASVLKLLHKPSPLPAGEGEG